jgi:hypothetical protein
MIIIRRTLLGIRTFLGISVAFLVAVPIALVLALIFYGMTLVALVRTILEFFFNALNSGKSRPRPKLHDSAEKISQSSQVPADGS